jgi:hypothetical protein
MVQTTDRNVETLLNSSLSITTFLIRNFKKLDEVEGLRWILTELEKLSDRISKFQ